MNDTPSQQQSEIRLDRNTREELVPGGFWWRFLATLVDGCVMFIVNIPVSILVAIVGGYAGSVQGETAEGNMLLIAVYMLSWVWQLVAIFFYYGWFYKNKGATPGKMAFGLRVVNDETGTNIGYLRSFFRETLGKFISILVLGIGYMMAGWTKEKTALHDLIFSTRVLRRKPK